MKFADPKNDLAFKKIFGNEQKLFCQGYKVEASTTFMVEISEFPYFEKKVS